MPIQSSGYHAPPQGRQIPETNWEDIMSRVDVPGQKPVPAPRLVLLEVLIEVATEGRIPHPPSADAGWVQDLGGDKGRGNIESIRCNWSRGSHAFTTCLAFHVVLFITAMSVPLHIVGTLKKGAYNWIQPIDCTYVKSSSRGRKVKTSHDCYLGRAP